MSESNSNKQWKRVPFDIELAKKIQSGEIEGKIISSKGYPVRIICFDYRNLKKECHILFAVEYSTHEGIFSCDDEGRVNANNFWLFIELPEETPKHDSFSKKLHDTAEVLAIPKHEFKPFDKVLVKPYDMSESMENVNVWRVDVFSHIDKCTGDYVCIGGLANPKYTLPYEANEHLVGTTNKPKED